jgi:hypothetical protein
MENDTNAREKEAASGEPHILRRRVSAPAQIGHIPQDMDDKRFIYLEG